jgi:hypothetical protein
MCCIRLKSYEKMKENIMLKIYEGASVSGNFGTGYKKILREQGFIS